MKKCVYFNKDLPDYLWCEENYGWCEINSTEEYDRYQFVDGCCCNKLCEYYEEEE